MELEASVPMKPYLLKFVQYMEGLEEGQVLDMNSKGAIAYLLSLIVTYKTNLDNHQAMKNARDVVNPLTYVMLEKYQAKLKFRVTARMQMFKAFYLSRDGVVVFNHLVRKTLHEVLKERIQYGKRFGIDEKDTIHQFMRELNYEESDISFDALKKASYRMRKSKEKEENSVNKTLKRT